ncbi:MAG: HAD family hydrolase [Candidatus Omnitrophica bacterium]|nr:HAD family hydrolase [Candidatus Omnitrophota bacterium]
MIIVLDLDDTLYDELSFVKSGFRAVSEYLYRKFSINPKKSFLFMCKKLKTDGRGRIFDDLLIKYGIYTKKEVLECIKIYRHHQPKISLFPDAKKFLKKFNKYPIYIVTDGNKIVQRNKIKALGLDKKAVFCYITNSYGKKAVKPSPYCFLKICKREKVSPKKVVYIGDNPYKDFVGIKKLGFKTIRIIRGQYKDVVLDDKFEADYKFNSLLEITEDFLLNITRM